MDMFGVGTGTGRQNQLHGIVGGTWIAPHAVNKASYTMSGCDIVNNFGMGFGSLPGQPGNSEATAREGMVYDITDCNTSTFLATAAGGGTGATAHRRVRYNASGAVWQVIG